MWSLISSGISSENTENKASSGVLIVAGSSRGPEFYSWKRDEPTSWFSVACFHSFSSIVGPRLVSPASVGPELLDLDLFERSFPMPFPLLAVDLAGRGIFSLSSDSLELDPLLLLLVRSLDLG